MPYLFFIVLVERKSYAYDWMSNPATIVDATGTHTFTYDYTTSGHPGLVSATIPYIVDNSINYGYDSMGRRTSHKKTLTANVSCNLQARNALEKVVRRGKRGMDILNYGKRSEACEHLSKQ